MKNHEVNKIKIIFSVIIPIFKVEKYLHECVDSVLNQTYENIEIIFVNDGSPDNCPSICDEYAANDKRVKVIHKVNGGLSEARNFGLKKALGEYVIFLDSDDYWEGTENLSAISNIIEKQNNIDIILFKRKYVYENEKVVLPSKLFIKDKYVNTKRDFVFSDLIKNGEFTCHACLKVIRRGILQENNLYFKENIKSEDIEWYLRVLTFINSYALISNPFYIYRAQRVGSITNTIGLQNMIDLVHTISERNEYIETAKNKYSKLFLNCYKSYLAYQLTIVCGYYNFLEQEDKKVLKIEIKKLTSLFKYTLYKKTIYIMFMYRLLGLSITSKILSNYISLRKKGKISW